MQIEEEPEGGWFVRTLPRQEGMRHDGLATLYEDREGNIWVGSDRGLCRVSPDPSVAHMRPEFDHTTVNAVAAAADGAVWVGTNNGLAKISNGRVRWYTTDDGLPGLVVRSIHVEDASRVWVVTTAGLARLVGDRLACRPIAGRYCVRRTSGR